MGEADPGESQGLADGRDREADPGARQDRREGLRVETQVRAFLLDLWCYSRLLRVIVLVGLASAAWAIV